MRDRRPLVRCVRAELRKLLNVSTLVLFAAFLLVLWQDVGRVTSFAGGQAAIAVAVAHDNQAEVTAACAGPARTVDEDRCDLARDTVRLNREFAPNSLALAHIAEALDSFPGVLTFVCHQAVSGLGWLLLALLAALHLGRERSSGSIATSLLCASRPRYLASKAVSLFVAAAVGIGVASVALYALRPTFRHPAWVPRSGGMAQMTTDLVPVTPDPTWASWSHALRTLLVALLLLASVALVFAALASLAREPVVAGAGLGLLVVGQHLLARWWHLGAWLPARLVSAAVGIDTTPFALTDVRLWDDDARASTIYVVSHRAPVSPGAVVGWLLAWSVVTLAAWHRFTHRWPD